MCIERELRKFIIQLRLLRVDLGFTQEEMSNELNVSYRKYQRMEAGEVYPNLNDLFLLSSLLKCSISQLFDYRDDYFEFITEDFILRHKEGEKFLEQVDHFENKVKRFQGPSECFLHDCLYEESFIKSDLGLLLSDMLKTVKNEELGKRILDTGGVLKQTAFKMCESKRLISFYNNTHEERERKFSKIHLKYKVGEIEKEFGFFCYSSFLSCGDQVVLAFNFE